MTLRLSRQSKESWRKTLITTYPVRYGSCNLSKLGYGLLVKIQATAMLSLFIKYAKSGIKNTQSTDSNTDTRDVHEQIFHMGHLIAVSQKSVLAAQKTMITVITTVDKSQQTGTIYQSSLSQRNLVAA
jgi:hypothetical protein